MSEERWDHTLPLGEAPESAKAFRCGEPTVDGWLHDKAAAVAHLVSTTFYCDAANEVVGFSATKWIIVDVTSGSNAQRSGSIDGQSVGYLLAQMGVREDLKGQGIGEAILRATMMIARDVYLQTPFPLFVVDALNPELVQYYEKRGLRPLAGDLRMVAPMKKIIASQQ